MFLSVIHSVHTPACMHVQKGAVLKKKKLTSSVADPAKEIKHFV